MRRSTIDRAVTLAAKLGAWGSLAAIAFATLSPIELRPHVAGVEAEHLVAFGVVGFLFALAYPRRALPVFLFVLAAAACLEIAQLFVPGRHGRLIDFAQKAIGGAIGLGFGSAVNRLRRDADPSRTISPADRHRQGTEG